MSVDRLGRLMPILIQRWIQRCTLSENNTASAYVRSRYPDPGLISKCGMEAG